MTVVETEPTPYTLISSDCHAGASHDTYRSYLEERYLDDFDAWRAAYKNPFRDLQGTDRDRNWNNERRISELAADGIVGEVIFPNTVPPFFPSMALLGAPAFPEDFELRLAGVRAHNRWLADWCGEYPEQRAGIGQIFLNDVDEAITDVRWIKEHDLRGGILDPCGAARRQAHRPPLLRDRYDPLWAVCDELGVVINSHSGSGQPDYGRHLATPFVMLTEIPFFTHRTLVHMLVSGVFERFPGLRFVLTEQGASVDPVDAAPARRLPQGDDRDRTDRRAAVRHRQHAPAAAQRVLRDELLGRCELPEPDRGRRSSTPSPSTASCGGATTRTRKGRTRTRARACAARSPSMPEADLRKIFAGNLAAVYDFDLEKLDALGRERRPDTFRDRGAARSRSRPTP